MHADLQVATGIYIMENSMTSLRLAILGLKMTLNGNGWLFTASVNAMLSIGADGSSEISNAQRSIAVLMNTDRFATYCPGQTLLFAEESAKYGRIVVAITVDRNRNHRTSIHHLSFRLPSSSETCQISRDSGKLEDHVL